ncbi:MAG: hypothetical protein PUD22_00735 [Erysipelotrichaceae bacterium]|nr:hypothetical protein [Erysipelotrichaceae bacterium]
MKITLKDLYAISDEKTYAQYVDKIIFNDNPFIRRAVDIDGEVTFYLDINDELNIEYYVKGVMICPCAYTLEDTEVPFEIEDSDKVVFDENKEGFLIREDLALVDLFKLIILPEVPIKVVKNGKMEYSSGDGWTFSTEEVYNDSRKEKIDPRWQKLMDLKFEEDE